MRDRRNLTWLSLVLVSALVVAACGDDDEAVVTATEAATTTTTDELCELLPTAEIGAVMNPEARVTTSSRQSESMCDLGIVWTGTSLQVEVWLLNNGGDAGFEKEVGIEATLRNTDPIDIAGVGDRAAGFGDRIIVQSGQSVVRIGGFPEELVVPWLEEIGRLIAVALG